MNDITPDTKFANKHEFLNQLTLFLINQYGARQCGLERIETEVPNSVKRLDGDFPTYSFKLAQDSLGTYSLKVQFAQSFSLLESELAHLALLLQTHFTKLHLLELESELRELSYRDEVTNLFNQRKLYRDLDQAITTFELQQLPFSLLFIDIDHFKSVNDGHGHLVGSKLLVLVGEEIQKNVRAFDLVYRYGGDEFVVFLPRATADEAYQAGLRILEAIRAKSFIVSSEIVKKLSVSIGVSDYPRSSSSREDVIRLADEMMYSAKKNGRGQVSMASGPRS